MKLKAFIGLAIVSVVVLTGWWLASRRSTPAARPLQITAEPTAKPAAVPTSTPFPSSPARMTAIVGRSKSLSSFEPPKAGWTAVEIITNPAEDYQRRAEAIARLPAQLTDADWQALKGFLLTKTPSDNGQLGQVLKNQLLDTLCAMNPPLSGLGDTLTQIYRDQAQNEVLRDYAVQHLAALDQQLARDNGPVAVQERRRVEDVLWAALDETRDSIAGTALLGLKRLSEAGDSVDENRIAEAALKLANDAAAGELTRITAFQVCGEMNVQEALAAIEAAAQNSPTASLQIAAIGALGSAGGKNDLPLLQTLLGSNDPRLQLPVQTAIERIEQRLQLHAAAR